MSGSSQPPRSLLELGGERDQRALFAAAGDQLDADGESGVRAHHGHARAPAGRARSRRCTARACRPGAWVRRRPAGTRRPRRAGRRRARRDTARRRCVRRRRSRRRRSRRSAERRRRRRRTTCSKPSTAGAISATYGVRSASRPAIRRAEGRRDLVVEDRVERRAQVGRARRALIGDLDPAVGERGRRPADRVAAGAADRLQAVLLEDRDAPHGRRLQPALGQHAEQEVEVAGVACHRPDRSEHPHPGRRRPRVVRWERDRVAARSQAEDARPARGRADRARQVAADAQRTHRRRERGRLAARGPAGAAREVVRVARGPVDAVDRIPERAELRQVGLAQQDRAGAAHPPDDSASCAATRSASSSDPFVHGMPRPRSPPSR